MSSLPPPPPPGSGPPPPPSSWNAPAQTPPAYSGGYGSSWPEQPSFQYAGFWNRVGAWILDFLMFVLPFGIVGGICLGNGWTVYDLGDGKTEWVLKNKGFAAAAIACFIAAFLCWAIVRVTGWKRGQTPGMRIAGTRIVRAGTGAPLGTGRAIGRFFAGYLSSWLFGLGYFWMIWDKQKRTWHDMMCETIVIKA